MRILLPTEVFHPETIGGAGRVVRELALNLGAMGHDVVVITRKSPGFEEEESRLDDLRIFRYEADTSGPVRAYYSTGRGVRRILSRLSGARWIPEVIHTHQPLVAAPAASAAREWGVPLLHTFYSSWPEEYLFKTGGGLMRRLMAAPGYRIERSVLGGASRVIVLSRYSEGEIRRLYPDLKTPIERIPGGVDPDRFRRRIGKRAARKALGIDPDCFLVLTIRNLVARMGIENLIIAARDLSAAHPNLLIDIVGDGPLRERLAGMIRESGLEGRVRLRGRAREEDLPVLLEAADLFCLPTLAMEGFGLVILEAFAAGLPVAGTPVGAIPELLALADDSLIFSSPQPESIRRGLDRIITGEVGLREIPPRLEEIARDHTWARMAERTASLYERIRF